MIVREASLSQKECFCTHFENGLYINMKILSDGLTLETCLHKFLHKGIIMIIIKIISKVITESSLIILKGEAGTAALIKKVN